jgi:hypothetical protein
MMYGSYCQKKKKKKIRKLIREAQMELEWGTKPKGETPLMLDSSMLGFFWNLWRRSILGLPTLISGHLLVSLPCVSPQKKKLDQPAHAPFIL